MENLYYYKKKIIIPTMSAQDGLGGNTYFPH